MILHDSTVNRVRSPVSFQVKVAEAKITEVQINEAREHYRLAASRASLLYFIINDLNIINPIYQFSLKVRLISSFILFTELTPNLHVAMTNANPN